MERLGLGGGAFLAIEPIVDLGFETGVVEVRERSSLYADFGGAGGIADLVWDELIPPPPIAGIALT